MTGIISVTNMFSFSNFKLISPFEITLFDKKGLRALQTILCPQCWDEHTLALGLDCGIIALSLHKKAYPLIKLREGVFYLKIKRDNKILSYILLAALMLGSGLSFFHGQGRTAPAFSPARAVGETVIIDAGHGGEDGGAVSISGVPESGINLAIALKTDYLLAFYGVETKLLRSTDISLHDNDAKTLRQKKSSDLRNRVNIIESTENATLISIHQNTFPSAKHHGAQVFYSNGELSLPLATLTQNWLKVNLDPSNTRLPAKIPDSVYIMKHITCRAILVECGFLSNREEDKNLQSPLYQTKIGMTLAGAFLQFQGMEPQPIT